MLRRIKQFLGLEGIPEALPMPQELKPAGKRSSRWARTRTIHLMRESVCRGCGTTKDLEVHHKIPFHLKPEYELAGFNLITLCESPGRNCHYALGHAYNWRGYNSHVVEDAALFLSRVKESAAIVKSLENEG